MPVIIDHAIKSYRLSLIKQSHQRYLAKNPHRKKRNVEERSATDVIVDACFALLNQKRVDQEFTLSPEEKALCGIV